jgi:hypothetical protein
MGMISFCHLCWACIFEKFDVTETVPDKPTADWDLLNVANAEKS